MSFRAQDLSVMAYANGFTHWHYRTTDSLGDLVDRPGYFAAAGEMLRPGDQLTVNLIGPDAIGLATLVVAAIPLPQAPRLVLVAQTQLPQALAA